MSVWGSQHRFPIKSYLTVVSGSSSLAGLFPTLFGRAKLTCVDSIHPASSEDLRWSSGNRCQLWCVVESGPGALGWYSCILSPLFGLPISQPLSVGRLFTRQKKIKLGSVNQLTDPSWPSPAPGCSSWAPLLSDLLPGPVAGMSAWGSQHQFPSKSSIIEASGSSSLAGLFPTLFGRAKLTCVDSIRPASS